MFMSARLVCIASCCIVMYEPTWLYALIPAFGRSLLCVTSSWKDWLRLVMVISSHFDMKAHWNRGTSSATPKSPKSAKIWSPSGLLSFMAKTFEYNPDGSYHVIEDDPQTGGIIIHHQQDVEPALRWAQKQRNSGVNDFGGARDGSDIKHYATVSMGAIISMRNEGIDFWNKDHEKAMLTWIERKAPKCKVTNRKIL